MFLLSGFVRTTVMCLAVNMSIKLFSPTLTSKTSIVRGHYTNPYKAIGFRSAIQVNANNLALHLVLTTF